nr:hypothetical protein GCM10020185_08660 [Pseudomonas brassicacearum subsp. brassicacearum]
MMCLKKPFPEKVQAYLASGRPLLGMINGEAARVINESGAGFTCASGDAGGLARITQTLAGFAPSQRKVMGESGRDYYLQHYSKQRLLARLEDIFRKSHATEGEPLMQKKYSCDRGERVCRWCGTYTVASRCRTIRDRSGSW